MPKETFIALLVLAVLLLAVYAIFRIRTKKKRKEREEKQKINRKVKNLSKTKVELTPQEFMQLRAQTFGERHKKLNFEGVYIIFNATKNKYYVGQGKKVLDRVNMHFTGKGNGDIYADYKYGDEFTIKIIGLKRSGYRSLNALERDTIATYDAYAKGYNKTKGNRD